MSDLDLLEAEQIDLDPEQMGLVDLATIDRIVEEVGRAPEAVIPLLHAIQREYRFLPREALRHVCDVTEITPASIMGVSTFYTHFRHKPIGKHLISVCQGTACHVKGSRLVQDAVELNLDIKDGQDTDADGRFTVQEVACLGCCTLGPVVQIDEGTYGHISAQAVGNMLQTFEQSSSKPTKKVTHRTRMSQGGEAGPEIRIGLGSCCLAQGAEGVHDAFVDELAASGASGSIKQVGCTGLCHQAPLIELNVPGEPTRLYTKLKPETARHIIREHFKPSGIVQPIRQAVTGLIDRLHSNEEGDVVQQHCVDVRDGQVCGFVGPQKHIATELCDFLDPLDLDEYLRHDGFVALKKCLDELKADEIIDEIKTSGLRGRGGGRFPHAH